MKNYYVSVDKNTWGYVNRLNYMIYKIQNNYFPKDFAARLIADRKMLLSSYDIKSLAETDTIYIIFDYEDNKDYNEIIATNDSTILVFTRITNNNGTTVIKKGEKAYTNVNNLLDKRSFSLCRNSKRNNIVLIILDDFNYSSNNVLKSARVNAFRINYRFNE